MTTSTMTEKIPPYIPVNDAMHLRRIGLSPYDADALRRVSTDPANNHLAVFEDWPTRTNTMQGAGSFVAVRRLLAWRGRAMPYHIIGGTFEDDAISGGELLGAVQLHDTDTQEPSISYWVTARTQGKGIAFQGVNALTSHAFSHGIERASLYINPQNQRSLSLADRLGAKKVGLFAINSINHQKWVLTANSEAGDYT